MKRIVLSGYYGFDNAGDEAVLAGLTKAFRMRCGNELVIEALSGAPTETARLHGTAAAHRMRIGPVIRAISRADLLASGGGSLLQDSTSSHSIFYYLAIVRLAQLLGKKTMFVAQGIGPLTLARSRKLTASVANRLDAITVRDASSAALLREIGVVRPPIEVTADPALLLDETDIPPDPKAGENRRSGIAVSLRPWRDSSQDVIDDLAAALKLILADQALTLVAMQPASDLPQGAAFASKRQVEGTTIQGPPWVHVRAARRVEMVIAMRLHALILAAGAGTAMVALSYDPKVRAFMEQIGQQDAVYDISDRNASRLERLLSDVWNSRGERSQAIFDKIPDMRAQATRNVDCALTLLA